MRRSRESLHQERNFGSPHEAVFTIQHEHRQTLKMQKEVSGLIGLSSEAYNDVIHCNQIIETANRQWPILIQSATYDTQITEERINNQLWEGYQRSIYDTTFGFCLLSPLTLAAISHKRMSSRTRKQTQEESIRGIENATVTKLQTNINQASGERERKRRKKDLKRFSDLLSRRDRLSESLDKLKDKKISWEGIFLEFMLTVTQNRIAKTINQQLSKERQQQIANQRIKTDSVPIEWQVLIMLGVGLSTGILIYPTALPITAIPYFRGRLRLRRKQSRMDSENVRLITRETDQVGDEHISSRIVRLRDIDVNREEIRWILRKEEIREISKNNIDQVIDEREMEDEHPPSPLTSWIYAKAQRFDQEQEALFWQSEAVLSRLFKAGFTGITKQIEETDLELLSRWIVADLSYLQGILTRTLVTKSFLDYLINQHYQDQTGIQQRIESYRDLDNLPWSELSFDGLIGELEKAFIESIRSEIGIKHIMSFKYFQELLQTELHFYQTKFTLDINLKSI